MINLIGKRVKSNKNLHCAYASNKIEDLEVYNIFTHKYETGEIWSIHNKCDCLFIAGFNIDIDNNNNQCRIYYGEAIRFGFIQENPGNLLLIPPGQNQIKNFIEKDILHFEFTFIKPNTMLELAFIIENYLNNVLYEIENIKKIHDENISICYHMTHVKLKNDLPF